MTSSLSAHILDASALPKLLGSSDHAMLAPFYRTLEEQLDDLITFLSHGGDTLDTEALCFRAHKYKTSASMAGATRLSEYLCEVEEKALLLQDQAELESTRHELLSICQSTKALVSSLIKRQ